MDVKLAEDEVLKSQKSGEKKIFDGRQDSKFVEEEILRFWKKNKIYEKVKKKNAKGKKFYFMDGPPYATGHIHMGTALNKITKDIAMRLKRQQGYDVFDRPGYDTHGVPIEFKVEKEIGSKQKQDIEKFGVKNFIERCKKFATEFIDVMNSEFQNLGVWMDWDNPYLSLSDEYVEAVWTAFKEADKKGLLYLGKYPVHVCSRCETAVAYNEIEYEKQRDNSVFVKFPLKDKKDTFLIIWTTTPWTLPGNTGVMVHPDIIYEEIQVGNEKWIIAKPLVENLMKKVQQSYKIKSSFKGKEMKNWGYVNPLAKNLKLKIKNGYKVVLSGKYVTTEDGSGLVHCAPGHGKEDYEVGKENNLDMPCPVDVSGTLTGEAGKYAGKKARIVDEEIIKDLESDGFLVHRMVYEHDYPLCWRCKTPLLMISIPQWFLKISKIHSKLLKENDKVNWVPDYMKSRMKAWLEGIGDWPVSRQRYWGTPLPIWYDNKSGEKLVIGSIEELKKLSGKKNIDVHKPGIDEITIKGKKGILKRVPEVLDVWFDSGVSSWAALGYPGEKEKFKKYWPADLNIEGKDQFRGWWNSQIILSEITFDKKPFENVAVHGMVLDVEKSKMSKSKGNIVSPKDIIEKYNRDYIRYYFAKLSKGEDFAFNENEFKEIGNFFRVLTNVNTFINGLERKKSSLEIEDKWIISRLNNTIKEVTEKYNEYKFHEVLTEIENFLMKDVSKTYIQMIRDRADEVYPVLEEIRLSLLKLLSPIIPFIAEKIWIDLRGKQVSEESVSLSDWPKSDSKKINKNLENDMQRTMKLIEIGLRERDVAQIGLRWPLKSADIVANFSLNDDLVEIIKNQLNVKEVNFDEVEKPEISLKLETKTTPELEAEGYAREISRRVQAERKAKGLKKEDSIELRLSVSSNLSKLLKTHVDLIKQRTGSKSLKFVDKIEKDHVLFKVREEEVSLYF